MDIKILDSWLREYLHTSAKPDEIAKVLSLTSSSIERVEKLPDGDFVYHVEVTTNRPDMASILGVAREAGAVLPHEGIDATFVPLRHPGENKVADRIYTTKDSIASVQNNNKENLLSVHNDPSLVYRICGVVMEVTLGESSDEIKKRLESAGIRSINNLVDITNYVMLEVGHPTHAFDYDKLATKKLVIRESKKGEKIVTLDKKEYTLSGGDIVADNGEGKIVDLLGVMGLLNSAVDDTTKRVLFFIDNNDPSRIRKTSMGLAIRTDAATLNEKGIDEELAMTALLRGIELYQQHASATIISDIIDIYPGKKEPKKVIVHLEKINTIIGVAIPVKTSLQILAALGFQAEKADSTLKVLVPSWREKDVSIEEDIIEEIARVYGYHNLPSRIPPFEEAQPLFLEASSFFWEDHIKDAMKYWGYTETYTYSLVSEELFEGPLEKAITLQNPLDADHMYLRETLTPSLLEVVRNHKKRESIQIFEIANTYHKQKHGLPKEVPTFALVAKGDKANFASVKGLLQQLCFDLGIIQLTFSDLTKGGLGADVYIGKEKVGEIEVLEQDLIACELSLPILIKHATLTKTYTPLAKYPSVAEDITVVIDQSVKTGQIVETIKKQSDLIVSVELSDMYQDNRTFHILYQDKTKNLTTEEVSKVRDKMISTLKKVYLAEIK